MLELARRLGTADGDPYNDLSRKRAAGPLQKVTRTYRGSARVLMPPSPFLDSRPQWFVMARQSSPRPLGDVLKEVIAQLDVQDGIDEARVVETWASVAGTDINSVTESVWMDDSTLYVKITSAPWRQELHLHRRQWRDKLNEELGKELVDEIVFR